MSLGALLLVLGWLGAGPALAQDAAQPAAGSPASNEGEAAPSTDVAPLEEVASDPDLAPSTDGSKPSTTDGSSTAGPSKVDPSMAELTQRLLGDDPLPAPTETQRKVEAMDLPETPGWIWPVGLTLLALLVGLRWQLNRSPEAPSRLRVTQRVMLGRDGNLAVVEVGEGTDRRRLLVGYGGGAPRLVAELDTTDAAPPASPRDSGTAARRWQQALQRATGRSTPTSGAPARPPAGASGSSERPALRRRASLIAEVLAERDTADTAVPRPDRTELASSERRPAPSAPPSPVVSEDDTGDDDGPSENYTFRGLIG